jgi:mevalonate kinase
MPAVTATAPGKIILFGEHAVVYGQPAIAVPVNQVRARTVVNAEPTAGIGEVSIQAPDINLNTNLEFLPQDHPIRYAVECVASEIGIKRLPACSIRITSSIPLSSGMGSSAAVSVALIRAFSGFLGQSLPDERISDLAYQVEKLQHGTPSGIDNTVITYAEPVYYQKGYRIERLRINTPITLVIADSGIESPTAETVADVRRDWERDADGYEVLFNRIGEISKEARVMIENGVINSLGPLMDKNHELLQRIGVSSQSLDKLVDAARDSGAMGAKLSGGGRGGNIIALVPEDSTTLIADALKKAGAEKVITTRILSI